MKKTGYFLIVAICIFAANIMRAENLPNPLQLSVYVGGLSTVSGVINFPDAEIPPDPNTPVVMSPAIHPSEPSQIGPATCSDYSYSIQGDNCFCVLIGLGSVTSKSCNVTISYHPLTLGMHHATITFVCSRGGIPVIVNVTGTATESPVHGDIDGDGDLSIVDATTLIDMLLTFSNPPAYADLNGDGIATIHDVTEIIDLLLSNNE